MPITNPWVSYRDDNHHCTQYFPMLSQGWWTILVHCNPFIGPFLKNIGKPYFPQFPTCLPTCSHIFTDSKPRSSTYLPHIDHDLPHIFSCFPIFFHGVPMVFPAPNPPEPRSWASVPTVTWYNIFQARCRGMGTLEVGGNCGRKL